MPSVGRTHEDIDILFANFSSSLKADIMTLWLNLISHRVELQLVKYYMTALLVFLYNTGNNIFISDLL